MTKPTTPDPALNLRSLGVIPVMHRIIAQVIAGSMLLSGLVHANDNVVSSKTADYPSADGKSLLQTVTYYRDGRRILSRMISKDLTGKTPDRVNEAYFVGEHCVYSRSTNPAGEAFFSHGDIDTSVERTNGDGKPNKILIVKHDIALIEWFELRADGYFAPVSAERFVPVQKNFKAALDLDLSKFLDQTKNP